MAHFSRAAMNAAGRISGVECLLAMFWVLSTVMMISFDDWHDDLKSLKG
jgi:hypothetical protein